MEILAQLTANGIIAAAIYALLAISFNVIYAATKFFNLAHGVTGVIGGYIVFWTTRSLAWPLIPSIILGILMAGLIGYTLERFIYLPLRARKASPMVLLIASLGAFTALQASLAIIFTSQFQTLSTIAPKVFTIGGAAITYTQAVIIVISISATITLALVLRYTMFGKAVRAISDDEEVAKIIGINTNRIVGQLVFVGSAIAGLAVILFGHDTGLEPTLGLTLLLKGVIAAIVGGIGSVSGGALGALLLGLIENFGIWKISGEWKDAIAFGLLIIFLLFRPRGIIPR